MKNNYHMLIEGNSKNIAIVLKCVLVGILAGSVAVLFRFALFYAEELCFFLYAFVRNHLNLLPLMFLVLCIMGYGTGYLISKNKMISGSGIPQVKGILTGHFMNRKKWYHTLILKFVGGAVSLAGGLSLGREGPSVQLGACVAEGVGKRLGHSRMERKMMIASGAGAGLAAAFNAPLAGVIFALEEIYKYFSPIILLSTMAAAMAADFVSKQFFGMNPIFDFPTDNPIPLKDYWLLLLLGIILGGLGAVYNFTILKSQKMFKSLSVLPPKVKSIIPFLVAGVLGLTFPVVLGGGHRVLSDINLSNGIIFLLFIFAVKFFFSMISFSSGAPGGIFFPLLILGALIGGIFAKAAISFGFDDQYFYNLVILAMAGYFTAIVKAPITGIILIIEMSESLNHMLPLTVVCVTAYVVADLLKSPAIYDALLDNLVAQEEGTEQTEDSRKVMIEVIVKDESVLENKMIKDIDWPSRSLLVNVKRGSIELIPKGDTLLNKGDYLTILTDINNEYRVVEELEEMNA